MRKLICALFWLFAAGCALSKDNPPDTALDYDYNISRSCTRNCKPDDNEQCRTAQSFASQAEFCEGLRDDKLNKGCARRERKARYFSRCGTSFEDINLDGWVVACPNGLSEESSLPLFTTRAQFCSDLTDSKHSDCSQPLRTKKSEWYECAPAQ